MINAIQLKQFAAAGGGIALVGAFLPIFRLGPGGEVYAEHATLSQLGTTGYLFIAVIILLAGAPTVLRLTKSTQLLAYVIACVATGPLALIGILTVTLSNMQTPLGPVPPGVGLGLGWFLLTCGYAIMAWAYAASNLALMPEQARPPQPASAPQPALQNRAPQSGLKQLPLVLLAIAVLGGAYFLVGGMLHRPASAQQQVGPNYAAAGNPAQADAPATTAATATPASQLTTQSQPAAVAPTAVPAPSADTDAEAAIVREFYGDWNAKRLSEAYALLSSRYQSNHPFDAWAKTHKDVIAINVDATAVPNSDRVRVLITSVDPGSGSATVHNSYSGYWGLIRENGTWRLDDPEINAL